MPTTTKPSSTSNPAAPAPPVKRGRGRPTKQAAEAHAQQQQLETLAAEVPSDSEYQEILRLDARDQYKASFHEFFLAAFPHVQGQTYAPTWFPESLCAELQGIGLNLAAQRERDAHLNIGAPPRSLKSVLTSVLFPIWMWLHFPNCAILSVSHNATMAATMMRFSKNVLESNWFQRHFPEFAPSTFSKYTETELVNSFKGSRRSFGVGADILGANANLIILDDIMDADTALSDTERGKVIFKVTNSIMGRLNDKQVDLIINVQQRLHVEDLTGYVLGNMADYWRSIKLPSEAKVPEDVCPSDWFYRYDNEYNAQGEVVGKLLADLKGKLSRKDLEFEKKRIGTLAYAQQHLQSPRAPEGGMFKTAWFQNQRVRADDFRELVKHSSFEWQLFIDGAQTDNAERDPTCIMLATKIGALLYVRQVTNLHKRMIDLSKYLDNYFRYLGDQGIRVARAYVEDKSIGLDLIDLMNRSSCPVPFIPLSTNNDPKHVRANRAVPFVEGKKLFLVEQDYYEPGDQYFKPWIKDFVDQVTGFTNGKGSKHDDAVDTMAYAIANCQVEEVWSG